MAKSRREDVVQILGVRFEMDPGWVKTNADPDEMKRQCCAVQCIAGPALTGL